MKTYLLILTLMATSSLLHATTYTVSNLPDSPGQFSGLQAAIDSASNGDTLLVAGSDASTGGHISYGNNIVLNKSLTLIGEGYNSAAGSNTPYAEAGFIAVTASNIYITGFLCYFLFDAGSSGIENITIERCRVVNFVGVALGLTFVGAGGPGNPPKVYRNFVFRNCVIQADFRFYGSNGVFNINLDTLLLENNLISNTRFEINNSLFVQGYNSVISGDSTFFLTHNTIISNGNNMFKGDFNQLVIRDNIYSGASPGGCGGCTFINNLTYQIPVADTLPYGNNIGAGNINQSNPLFVNYLSGTFNFLHDYNLQAGSLAINGASDGTNIGMTGGSYPFVIGLAPSGPQIQYLNILNSAIPVNGTLEFDWGAWIQN